MLTLRYSYFLSRCGYAVTGVLTGATRAQNAKISGKFDGHLRLSEGLSVTSSGEAKGVSACNTHFGLVCHSVSNTWYQIDRKTVVHKLRAAVFFAVDCFFRFAAEHRWTYAK